MTDVSHWSPTDASNQRSFPDGAPGGWPGLAVGQTVRGMMGAVARYIRASDFVDLNWIYVGGNPSTATAAVLAWVSNTSFTIGGAGALALDATGWMLANRRFRAVDGGAVTYDGFIVSSSFNAGTGLTTVTVNMDGGVLPNPPVQALVGTQPTLNSIAFTGQAYGIGGVRNAFANGGFDIWQRGVLLAPANQTVGVANFLADRWYVNPAGAACTLARSGTLPTGAASRYGLLVTGNSGTLAVLIGQRIEAADMPALMAVAKCTYQIKVLNNTGAGLTPVLVVSTPNASDNFSAVTTRITQSLSLIASGGSATLSFSFAVGTMTNALNGLMVELQIPNGALAVNTQSVTVTDAQLEGASAATPIERLPVALQLARCQRYWAQTYEIGTVAGTATQIGAVIWGLILTGPFPGTWRFPVTMRVAPTVTFYSSSTGTSNRIFRSADGDQAPALVGAVSSQSVSAQPTTSGSTQNCVMQATANAEL